MERTPISNLEDHLGFWLRFVSNHVSARFQQQVEAKGVSVSEWVALRCLFGKKECSAAGLMDALGMTKGAVSKIVTRLQDKALVKRVAVESDGRAQQLVLTPAGRALVPQLAALADQNDQAFFGHLARAEQTKLMSLMKSLVNKHSLKEVPLA